MMGLEKKQGLYHREIGRVQGHSALPQRECLAVEEPLEIRLEYRVGSVRERRSISITMRTPGQDFALAVGFLFTEGILSGRADFGDVQFCGPSGNVVRVDLSDSVTVDLKRLERHFYTTSSCGVCGKSSIEALRGPKPLVVRGEKLRIAAETIHRLPATLRRAQSVFELTGGLHASARFTARGELVSVFEDVGRHNALDKLIGDALINDQLPFEDSMLLVSGRASFELAQKAAVAGFPILVAVGAPSSLAVELADEVGMTLIGFVRDERFNMYCHGERIILHV